MSRSYVVGGFVAGDVSKDEVDFSTDVLLKWGEWCQIIQFDEEKCSYV